MSNKILDAFGIGEMPWIIRVYLLLVFASIGLILLPGLAILDFDADSQASIIGFGADSLKLVIGAVLGSLSMAAKQEWGGSEPEPEPDPNTSGPAGT